MDYQGQLYLFKYQYNQELILKESEDFYKLIKAIKYKCIFMSKKVINFFVEVPNLLDFLCYLLFRIQTI